MKVHDVLFSRSALESISAQHEGELKTAKRQAAEKAKSELREPLEQANAKVAQLEDDLSEKQQVLYCQPICHPISQHGDNTTICMIPVYTRR